jgi:aspartate aminotransferase-like enzyme
MTFRIGLFGLEKLHNPARSVQHLAAALDQMGYAAVQTPEPALA